MTSELVVALCLEKERRLADDLSALGPRPPWWRWRARRDYDRGAARLRRAHANDLRTMLATEDPVHRAVVANLIGWRLPTDKTQAQ